MTDKVIKKGFTLVELLVVIGIMAVLASAVMVLIDPADKLKAASDSRVQADIGQIATALTAYYAANSAYPTTTEGLQKLKDMGELVNVPTPPSSPTGYGGSYTYTGTTTTANISGTVLSKKYTGATPAINAWAWCNGKASAGGVASLGTCP